MELGRAVRVPRAPSHPPYGGRVGRPGLRLGRPPGGLRADPPGVAARWRSRLAPHVNGYHFFYPFTRGPPIHLMLTQLLRVSQYGAGCVSMGPDASDSSPGPTGRGIAVGPVEASIAPFQAAIPETRSVVYIYTCRFARYHQRARMTPRSYRASGTRCTRS